jgi:PD-(D/E)XK nuclease superfamily
MAAKRKKRKMPSITQHQIESEGKPSGSGFDAEFRCPGKRALCATLPEEEDTAAANRGVRIHKAIESWDLEKLADTERRTAQRIMYGESEIVHEYNFEGAITTFEERVWDFDEDFNKLWSARVDRYDVLNRRLLVIDDKSGWTTPPPVHMNWQIRSEGALLANLLDATETVVALIHPYHPDSLWEAKVYTRDETNVLLDTVRANVVAIQQPDAPRIPGGIQCQWCEAKRICPEFKAECDKLTQAIDDEIEDEGFTAIIRRSKKERGEHVMWLKEVVKSCEYQLEQYVELMERQGEDSIKGWRLRRKLTKVITNELRAMELTKQRWGEDVMASALKFNLVALEDELKKTMGARAAKRAVIDLLGPVIRYDKSKNWLDEARSL